MTLKNIRDWLKPQITDITMAYIGKTDPLKEKSICIYGRPSAGNRIAIGGITNTTTANKTISILVQWSKNCDTAEQASQTIYSLFESKRTVINGTDCFFQMMNDEPVLVGANDNDIYEYVIDINIVYKRG
jgi:hypothetical protein